MQIECTQILFSSKPCLNKHSTIHDRCYSLDGEEVKDKIPPRRRDKTALLSAIDETTSWLDANQAAEKEEYEEKQKALEGIAMPILQKMAGGAGGGMPDMGGMGGGMPDMGGMGGAPAEEDPAGGPTIEEID